MSSATRDIRVALAVLLLTVVPVAAQEADEPQWSFSAGVYTYFLPDEGNYGQPTFTADRKSLHLEARYNYEALRTGSLWAGYVFGGGERVEWEVTPMFGAVFGETKGAAPGYNASVSWWKLDAYSEGEYVFATEDEESFAYNWSEVAIAPIDWLRVGMVTQRTHAYDSEREVQRGPFVNATFKSVDAGVYFFNPDDSDPIVVVSVGVSF